MDCSTVQQVIDAHNNLSTWSSKLVVPHGEAKVDVSCAALQVGCIRRRPPVSDLPCDLPNNSLYRFDPNIFCGEKCAGSIESIIKESCDGCTLHVFRSGSRSGNRIYYSLRCACYRVEKQTFDPNKFSKHGVKPEEVIQTNSINNRAFSRMGEPKLKSKKRKRKICSDSRNSTQKPRKISKQPARRTKGNASDSRLTSCDMCVTWFMDVNNGCFYLCKNSVLQHSYHSRLEEQDTLLSEDNLNEDQMNFVIRMHQEGVNNTSISTIMTKILNDKGIRGEFVPSATRNMTRRMQEAIDTIDGISSDYSIAEKSIHRLNKYVTISHLIHHFIRIITLAIFYLVSESVTL